jgi:hypothetical protein
MGMSFWLPIEPESPLVYSEAFLPLPPAEVLSTKGIMGIFSLQ